jgi:hypothetical protein
MVFKRNNFKLIVLGCIAITGAIAQPATATVEFVISEHNLPTGIRQVAQVLREVFHSTVPTELLARAKENPENLASVENNFLQPNELRILVDNTAEDARLMEGFKRRHPQYSADPLDIIQNKIREHAQTAIDSALSDSKYRTITIKETTTLQLEIHPGTLSEIRDASPDGNYSVLVLNLQTPSTIAFFNTLKTAVSENLGVTIDPKTHLIPLVIGYFFGTVKDTALRLFPLDCEVEINDMAHPTRIRLLLSHLANAHLELQGRLIESHCFSRNYIASNNSNLTIHGGAFPKNIQLIADTWPEAPQPVVAEVDETAERSSTPPPRNRGQRR